MTPEEIKNEAVLYAVDPFTKTWTFTDQSLVAFVQRIQHLALEGTKKVPAN